jgi:general stress protein YciG
MENENTMNRQPLPNERMPDAEEKQSNVHRRGFASMTPDKQRRIASKGGRAAHKQGVAHQWSADEARVAGKKGGQVSGQKRSKKGDEPDSETAP